MNVSGEQREFLSQIPDPPGATSVGAWEQFFGDEYRRPFTLPSYEWDCICVQLHGTQDSAQVVRPVVSLFGVEKLSPQQAHWVRDTLTKALEYIEEYQQKYLS